MAGKIILYICLILYLIGSVKSSKLNVPRVLLPIFSDFSINFTLEATEGGCYKWTTSRLDIVQLTPLYDSNEECSSRALVSSISKEATRNTAIVLAEELYTGQVLRCDVIVDVIHSLDIVTTTRELYMEEAPEAFEVRAYDDQGNEFTTLENVKFDWVLTCTGRGARDDLNVLRFMTFRDSPYETPKSVQAFEELGLKGHIILLEGIKTGSAKVSVRLPYSEYQNVQTAEVSLMVVANLLIEPADIYILRGDVVQYRIIQVKHGRLEQIELATSQYYLKVENDKIGHIDKQSGIFTGLQEGKTRIVLYDRNVDAKNDAELKLPSTSISVTFPARLSLSILPHHNWAVLLGEKHEIMVEVFAKNDHKIYLGEGVQFKTKVDEALFPVYSKSENGSWFAGTAKVNGTALVTCQLISLSSEKLGTVILEPALSISNEILIFPQITITPNEVMFPWDSNVQTKYEIQMRAFGGDGKFIWSSSNHTIGTVSQTGLSRTYFHGQYDICASMSRNTYNKKCSRFYVIPPTKLEIIEYVMENEINKPIYLHVALYAQRPGLSTLIPFTQCDKLNIKVKPSDYNFVFNETAKIEPVGVACKTLAVVGLAVANSRVTAFYNSNGNKIEDSVMVSAYRPLVVLNPLSMETVLAPGASRNIIFTGGPRPWIGRSSEHTYKIDSTNNLLVGTIDKTHLYRDTVETDMYVAQVNCRDIGEAQITLTVANKPLFHNCKHQASIATATVYCSLPHSIYLQPKFKSAGAESCPMDLSAERVVVQSYTDVNLDITVKDDSGRIFDNITSYKIDWIMTPAFLGTTVVYRNMMPRNFTYENVLLPDGQYQSIIPQSQTGILDVTARIVGYVPEIMNSLNVKDLRRPIHTKVSLYLVDDTVISPNYTSVYNHVENKFYINVLQGSGFYTMTLSSENIADIKYLESKRQLEVIPQSTGELRVSLNDLCLKSEPAVIHIKVFSVARLSIEVPDKVQIGKTIKAIVKFYDDADNIMPLPNLDYLDLRYIMEDDILNVKMLEENPTEPWGVGEVHYVVRGLQLGDTQIVFATGRGTYEIVSQPVSIQVFSPIKLVPRNTTLLVGAQLELTIQGGPQPDANIEFLVQHDNIIEVDHDGLIKALAVGTTRIIGRSVGVCPSTGDKIIHSQDMIDVHVIPLTGIKIVTPLTRFMQGTTVPAWFTGLPESLSPLLIGSIRPSFNINWITNDCADIIDMYGIFRDIGVKYKTTEEISVHLKGIKPGRCNLMLNVTVSGATAGISQQREAVYSANIDLEVFEQLVLMQPRSCSQTILMAPYSNLQLVTNLEGRFSLTYSLQDEHFREDKSVTIPNTVVTISENGLLQSFGIIGRAMVIITASDEHGLKQSITSVVQVKPIHYMMAKVQTDWMVSSGTIPHIPLGAELKFTMSYHDNTGATFTAATVDIKYKSNRFDLVESKRAANNDILSYIVKPGTTMLKIWAESTQKTVDYINIVSDTVMFPVIETLNSGDVFCLKSPIVDKYNKHGNWFSDDSEIIKINTENGMGQVVSETTSVGSIYYSLTSAVKARFNIEPVKVISVKYDKSKIISNVETPVVIPFLLSGSQNMNTKKNNFVSSWPCEQLQLEVTYFPFKCQIKFTDSNYDINEIFHAVPSFSKELGLFSCNLIRKTEVTARDSTIESNITLTIILNNGIQSEPVELIYKPAVFISTDNLVLSDANLDATLTITGLSDVLNQIEIIPIDPNLLEINGPNVVSTTTVTYDVRLIDYHWKFPELQYPLSVTVVSKITNQNIKVIIKTLLGQDFNSRTLCMAQLGSPAGNFFYHNRHALTIILSMLILFFLTVYAYSHYIQPVINVNVGPARSTLGNYPSPDTSPLMLHSTPSRLNGSHHSAFCSPNTCPSINKSINTMNASSLSTSPRYIPRLNDTSPDLSRTFNSSDVRRNRRFL